MTYGVSSLIFTKHARERMQYRHITAHAVADVVSYPDRTQPTNHDTTKYIRTLRERTYHVVAKNLVDERKLLIVSVWVRGEEDQSSIVWQVITAPFRFVFWFARWLFSPRSSR